MENTKFFKAKKVAEGVTLIEDLGKVLAFLVEGESKAMLIDSLCGIGNIAEFCKGLTSLPVIVANTHGHHDHVSGNFLFEEAFIHPADVEMMYTMSSYTEEEEMGRVNYVRMQQEMHNEPIEWTLEDVVEVRKIRCNPIEDGDTFDLGGRTIEVIGLPGHTKGSVCFLDRKNRLMFAGDGCNSNTIIYSVLNRSNAATVEEYYDSLMHLKKFQGYFDNFYIGHGLGEYLLDKSVIDEAIECCKEIMAGTDDAEPGMFLDRYPCLYAKKRGPDTMRLDGGVANIAYEKDNIFKKK